MITFNMILHVSCIMNEGSEGMAELEKNRCRTAKKIFDVRPASYVLPGLYPATIPRPMFIV